MPPLVIIKDSSHRAVVMAMTLLLALTFWLYQLGFSAVFQFDDRISLAGATRVNDLTSALAYIFDGRTGTLGRPLVLATFLLQKDSWPNHPASYFLVNTLIHLFNGVLVYWFSYRLTPLFPEKIRNPAWFPLAVTALWLTLPLHVSASLAAVQRMTTLSSTFILLGLIGYLSGRAMLDKSPARAYVLMTISVAGGTAMALACKEIGASLLFYVAVLEATIIRSAGFSFGIRYKRWAALVLGLPFLLLLAYFAYGWSSMMQNYAFRSFSLSERLLTESRVLWEYLGQVYIPARGGTGPYHDDYSISKSVFDPAVTALAILAWVSALFLAWRLRNKFPVILFGFLWFLAGHLIESSFIPLELYFEHRNYIPSVGPLLAACFLLWHVPVKVLRMSMAALVMMVFLRLFILGETTQLWGQPLLAANLWVEEHPQSVRAAQFLSVEYFYAGDIEASRKATLDGHARIGHDIGLAMQSVYLSCQHDEASIFLARVKAIEPVLMVDTGGQTAVPLLNKMLDAQQQGGCQNLTLAHLDRMTDQLLANPHNQYAPSVLAALHVFKYRLYALQGKPNLSIRELFTAFLLKKDLTIAVATATVVAEAGRYGDALAFLDQAMSFAPRNPIVKLRWKTEIDEMKLSIRQRWSAVKPEK